MSDLANAVLAAVAGRDPKDKPVFVPKGITDAELDALDLGDMKWAVDGLIGKDGHGHYQSESSESSESQSEGTAALRIRHPQEEVAFDPSSSDSSESSE